MAKRFTDTDKWKSEWFVSLSLTEKCFLQYLHDNCDNAGMWNVNFGLASYQIGTSLNSIELKNKFADQIIDLGNKWFIKEFIEFQYDCSYEELNPKNNAHLSVIKKLKKYGFVFDEEIDENEGLIRGLEAPQDKDKDMNKDINKDKELNTGDSAERGEESNSTPVLQSKNEKKRQTQRAFEEFYKLYPKKEGRKMAEKAFFKIKPELYPQIMQALELQINNNFMGKDKQFIKMPATWLNQECWDDEIIKLCDNPNMKNKQIGNTYIY